jgi:hypothetical protein
MGNMPLRYYIKEHGMTHVNKIAFVAPPFLGGAEAISALCVGQGMFFNQDEVRKLARSLPALFELLPTYKHFAINSKTGADVNLWNKNNWQSNLITEGGDPVKNKSIKKFVANLKSAKTALDGVENWHEGLTDQEKERILVLVKTEMKTMMDVVVEKNPTDGNPANFIDFNKSLFSEEGDGIVPNASSCCYFDQFATYCFQNRLIQDDFKHPFFLKDNRVQNFINSFFNSNLGTGTFKLDLIGRTVHKVKNLAVETIEHKGVNHKLTKIVV